MEEKKLVQQSLEGNMEAFGELVKKYKTKVFNLAYSLTRNRESADDLAQEIFIKIYLALHKFKFKSGFGTWLYRISINHITDFLRKEGKIHKVPFEETMENATIQEDEIKRKERAQLLQERKKLVHKAIASLPEKYQIILTLRDIQEFSYGEITKILKLSPGTVDSRLHRARKILKKKLTPSFTLKGENYEL